MVVDVSLWEKTRRKPSSDPASANALRTPRTFTQHRVRGAGLDLIKFLLHCVVTAAAARLRLSDPRPAGQLEYGAVDPDAHWSKKLQR